MEKKTTFVQVQLHLPADTLCLTYADTTLKFREDQGINYEPEMFGMFLNLP